MEDESEKRVDKERRARLNPYRGEGIPHSTPESTHGRAVCKVVIWSGVEEWGWTITTLINGRSYFSFNLFTFRVQTRIFLFFSLMLKKKKGKRGWEQCTEYLKKVILTLDFIVSQWMSLWSRCWSTNQPRLWHKSQPHPMCFPPSSRSLCVVFNLFPPPPFDSPIPYLD